MGPQRSLVSHGNPACSGRTQKTGWSCSSLALSSFVRNDFHTYALRPPSPTPTSTDALCREPPLVLMEVLWHGQGSLLERGLRLPACKHDLFLCKRQDFKINQACMSDHAREEATCPTTEGSIKVLGTSLPRRPQFCPVLPDFFKYTHPL